MDTAKLWIKKEWNFLYYSLKSFCDNALNDQQIPLMKYIRGTTKKKVEMPPD